MTVRRLTRQEASAYLKEKWGVERKPSTLAKLVCTGGGPRLQWIGRKPFYTEAELDAWIESLLSPLKASTSDRLQASQINAAE